MNQRNVVMTLSMLLGACAFARSPQSTAPPLLPPPESAKANYNYPLYSKSYYAMMAESTDGGSTSVSASATSGEARPTVGIGFELGSIARPSATSDLAGLQLLPGGRIFMRFSPMRKIFVKPALGFFYRSRGAGSVSVGEYSIEAGGTVYYTPLAPSRFQWFVGGAARMEAMISRTSVFGNGDTSPASYRFRMGPATGIAYAIDPRLSFVSDAEVTAAFTQPVRTYVGLTLGFVYKY
jgi:hypothetical protein